ncbi:hypothetical protein BIFANG_03369 [Bifidobacterium angulatum DSM 20098 = JCM 7096]|uniref:Uncharacterized protein n=1 Tax=Bifidobacterium angulatum DSM 20098 = JCM 7096 TaxID=518635 RepID=C4FGA1_9BIFI|nr:hypothetical protein BIFANG_03369 [Bifidobacterium angulatum DSM 20098 = JCM 7096]BAQ96821.1 hypothetical protein BBAG_1199 [Bifidobacterium angulatum DSM 20098 = JCM 7096]
MFASVVTIRQCKSLYIQQLHIQHSSVSHGFRPALRLCITSIQKKGRGARPAPVPSRIRPLGHASPSGYL